MYICNFQINLSHFKAWNTKINYIFNGFHSTFVQLNSFNNNILFRLQYYIFQMIEQWLKMKQKRKTIKKSIRLWNFSKKHFAIEFSGYISRLFNRSIMIKHVPLVFSFPKKKAFFFVYSFEREKISFQCPKLEHDYIKYNGIFIDFSVFLFHLLTDPNFNELKSQCWSVANSSTKLLILKKEIPLWKSFYKCESTTNMDAHLMPNWVSECMFFFFCSCTFTMELIQFHVS